jgi:hypothetical protein
MISLKELEVRLGDPIYPAWQKLLKWARSLRLISTGDVILDRGPDGTRVYLRRTMGWNHPFLAGISDTKVTVGRGTLNGREVWMDDRYLDGTDRSGNDLGEPPTLDIGKEPPDEGRYTWLLLYAANKGGDDIPEIRHSQKLEETGTPLAVIQWDSGDPVALFQVIYLNQKSQPASTGKRIHYFPA